MTPTFEEKGHQLHLVHEELNRRQDSQSRRLGTAETSSGVLIASSALVTTIIATTATNAWDLIALFLGLAAAGCGVASLFPRVIEELTPSKVRERVLSRDRVDSEIWLIDQKVLHIAKREKTIALRLRLVQYGLSALAAALGAIVMAFLDI